MTFTLALLLLAIGLFVGFASNVFGLGGGILIMPLLPLLVEINQHDLVATSLTCILLVVSSNVLVFALKKQIDWSTAYLFGTLAALGAFISSSFSYLLSEQALRWLSLSVIILVSLLLFSRQARHQGVSGSIVRWLNWPFGFFAGVISGLTGVGSGAILGPYFISQKIVSHERVSPTLNFVLTITTLSGVIAYALSAIKSGRSVGSAIQIQYVIPIVVGAWVASKKARHFQEQMSEAGRKIGMILILTVLALFVLYTILKNEGFVL